MQLVLFHKYSIKCIGKLKEKEGTKYEHYEIIENLFTLKEKKSDMFLLYNSLKETHGPGQDVLVLAAVDPPCIMSGMQFK